MLAGEPARSPEDVAGRILAIQAQDPRGARLAIRARSTGLTAAGVDRAFSDDRSIVITWLNRGTLHLVRSEDYPWLHSLCAPRQIAWIQTRLGQIGVAPDAAERGVRVIVDALGSEGPLTRAELVERLARNDIPTAGQAIVHQIGLASLRGLIVRGPMRGREQCLVLVRDWLGDPPAFDYDRALAGLARRYLAGHGPATERDLAYWTGLPVTVARAAFRAIASEAADVGDGLIDLAGRGQPPELPPPRLLGPFDPLLHGWSSRDPIVGRHGSLVTSNGIFRPMLLVQGRAAGTWGLAAGRVSLQPFEDLDGAVVAALESDARDVERYMKAPGS
jgi:hypothetical protein